jgi:hypothetical protein
MHHSAIQSLRDARLKHVFLTMALFGLTPCGVRLAKADLQSASTQNQEPSFQSKTVFDLSRSGSTSGGITLHIPINGRNHLLDLHPVSVRSTSYRLLVQESDGSYRDLSPGPERTFRGRLHDIEGAQVAMTRIDEGWQGVILMPDRTRYWIEPAGSAEGQEHSDRHIVYRSEDRARNTAPRMFVGEVVPDPDVGQTVTLADATGIVVAELAIDADFEYFNRYGSIEAVEAQISSIINTTNIQFDETSPSAT